MKSLTALIFCFISTIALSQVDQTPIVVNIRDNAKLQFNGQPVKQKATVIGYVPVINTTKDFLITLSIQMFESVSGAYGNPIINTIQSDATLSQEEKDDLSTRYADRIVTYTTAGRCVNASGNQVGCAAGGAQPEIQYWQGFKLNQVNGMGSLSTQGAIDAQYLVIKAIVNKMDSRKNF